jgi:hypothetical protein
VYCRRARGRCELATCGALDCRNVSAYAMGTRLFEYSLWLKVTRVIVIMCTPSECIVQFNLTSVRWNGN